jgi:hypothetical protein
MVKVSKADLAKLAVAFGIADFFSGGKLQAPIGNAARRALVKAAPAIARGIIRYGPTVATTAARVTPGPLAAAAVGATVIANRERITDAAGNVYERVLPAAQDYGAGVMERALDPATYQQPMVGPTQPEEILIQQLTGRKPRRKKSIFNKAVSAGMKAVKSSTSYGKKGTINNAKKAFAAVTRTASRINKGGKVAKKGVARKIGLAVKKVLK